MSNNAIRAGAAAVAVLRIEGVTKGFRHGWLRRGRTEVLRGATMEARPGELIGLVGENGSGKSVLMRIIVGMLARDGGEIERGGTLGYCPQEPLLLTRSIGRPARARGAR